MGTHTHRHGESPPQIEDALARHAAGGEASVQVTKPFTPTDLLREVRSALDGERPSAPAPG